LTGALHDETSYGRPRQMNGKEVVHIRKAVSGLSAADIENIVDPAIRASVKERAAQFNGDLKNWAWDESSADWPQLRTKSGTYIPIKRVRIWKPLAVHSIATGTRMRHVAISSNHHVAHFARLDERGREKRWEAVIVSLFEAMDRKRQGLTVLQTKNPGIRDWRFKFSLMGGDTLLLHKNCNHNENLCRAMVWRLRSIATNGQLSLVRANDARLKGAIVKAKEWWSPRADALRK